MGRFIRFKVSLDLRKPLMRATLIRFQERSLRIYFKYERLPTFCFSCGKIGHQVKDCETLEGKDEEGFEDIEEIELSFGPWLRASPLPKTNFEQRVEQSPSNYSKNLFASSSSSKCNTTSGFKRSEEIVEQTVNTKGDGGLPTPIAPKTITKNLVAIDSTQDIERVAESLGTMALATPFEMGTNPKKDSVPSTKKWTRKKVGRKPKGTKATTMERELGKRQLVDVLI